MLIGVQQCLGQERHWQLQIMLADPVFILEKCHNTAERSQLCFAASLEPLWTRRAHRFVHVILAPLPCLSSQYRLYTWDLNMPRSGVTKMSHATLVTCRFRGVTTLMHVGSLPSHLCYQMN
jgi:hypothetical protein